MPAMSNTLIHWPAMFCFKYCCVKYWIENEFRMCLIYSVTHYNHVTRKLFQIYFSHKCMFWLWNMCIIFDCIAKVVGVFSLRFCLIAAKCSRCMEFFVHCSLLIIQYMVTIFCCLIHVIGFICITGEPIQFLKHLNGLLGNISQLQCNSYMLSRTSKFIKINSNAILRLMMPKQFWNARIITLLWLFLR